MASSIPTLPSGRNPLLRRLPPRRTTAEFRLPELMGGRGLCKGERGIQKELLKPTTPPGPTTPPQPQPATVPPPPLQPFDDAFEKELLGLTGGFPGGEKGLELFIQNNPPPPKKKKDETYSQETALGFPAAKPRPPELPLLMPGMAVIVKNPGNPFHMFTGIVQRVTDGKAGVLFEGGNWDRLITFDLGELERRDKGPPMVNPKSAVLESLAESLRE